MNALEIKKIRKSLGLSQTEFGRKLGVGIRSVQLWESGQRNISKSAKILLDNLIESEQSTQVRESSGEYLTNKNGNKFKEKNYGYNLTVNLLPFESYAGYVESLEDVLVAYDFDEVTFNVDQYGHGNYMAFKIKGDSMNGGGINDTMDKALVLGREVGRHLWINGFHKAPFGFIILSKTNIYHKDIKSLDKSTGDIILSSRDGITEDFTINLNDVYAIYHVIKRIQ